MVEDTSRKAILTSTIKQAENHKVKNGVDLRFLLARVIQAANRQIQFVIGIICN